MYSEEVEFETFFEENKNLIFKLVNKYRFVVSKNWISVDDLFQHGSIAMFKAWKSFDPSKGFKLSTYVYTIIKNELETVINNALLPSGIKASPIYRRFAKEMAFMNTSERLKFKESRMLTDKEFDEALKIIPLLNHVSLNKPRENNEDKSLGMLSTLEDCDDESIVYIEEYLSKRLRVTEQTIAILIMNGYATNEIGKLLGISGQQVRNRIDKFIVPSLNNYMGLKLSRKKRKFYPKKEVTS